MKSTYQIIYLNGPSSVGKSTLARTLQEKLKNPFLVVGIDQLIFMMPKKLNDWHNGLLTPGFSWQPVKDKRGKITAHKIHVGPFGKRIVQAFKKIVVTLAQSGHYLIIDDVSFGKEQVDEWRQTLKNFNVLWIGLIAPIKILEQREKKRGDRKLGSSRWQAERVHLEASYDLVIDTNEKNIDENVNLIQQHIDQKL